MKAGRVLLFAVPAVFVCLAAGISVGLRGGTPEPTTSLPAAASRAAQSTGATSTPTLAATNTTTALNTTVPSPATSAIPATTAPPITTTADAGRNLLGGHAPEDKLMPNVVCLDLQSAQDLIQDHGVFYSKSVDASGKGRRQILDRNWIVVSQKPEAGAKVGEGDAVLSVVKKGEASPC
jgi:hypothetical protein